MIPGIKSIELYLHCGLCVEEVPEGVSPSDYADTETGWTKLGLQIWCKRHNCNVVHIDFEGHTHPANVDRNELRVV